MRNTTLLNMQKRGQVTEAIGALFLIGIIVLGSFGSYKIISDNRFVGNEENGMVYDLKYCDTKIPKDKMISFQSKEEAYTKGFKDAECNK